MKRLLIMLCCLTSLIACHGRARPAAIAKPTAVNAVFVPRIHFLTGTDQWDDDAEKELQQNVSWLVTNPRAVLVLEGHCDERGSSQLNMELGDRRARRVKAYLIAHTIDADRLIMVVSHGAERPLDPRHTTDAWRQNRRVEFIVR